MSSEVRRSIVWSRLMPGTGHEPHLSWMPEHAAVCTFREMSEPSMKGLHLIDPLSSLLSFGKTLVQLFSWHYYCALDLALIEKIKRYMLHAQFLCSHRMHENWNIVVRLPRRAISRSFIVISVLQSVQSCWPALVLPCCTFAKAKLPPIWPRKDEKFYMERHFSPFKR